MSTGASRQEKPVRELRVRSLAREPDQAPRAREELDGVGHDGSEVAERLDLRDLRDDQKQHVRKDVGGEAARLHIV